jgi:hypothetical protein
LKLGFIEILFGIKLSLFHKIQDTLFAFKVQNTKLFQSEIFFFLEKEDFMFYSYDADDKEIRLGNFNGE